MNGKLHDASNRPSFFQDDFLLSAAKKQLDFFLAALDDDNQLRQIPRIRMISSFSD